MSKRKTLEVERLREMVNTYLRDSADDRVSERFAQAALLSAVLHETGNYFGFVYLDVQNGRIADESRRRYINGSERNGK